MLSFTSFGVWSTRLGIKELLLRGFNPILLEFLSANEAWDFAMSPDILAFWLRLEV